MWVYLDVLDAERMDQETGTQRLSRRQRKNRKLRAEKETPPSSTTSSPGVRKKPKPLAKKQTMDLPNEIIYTSTLPILNKYKQLTNHQVEIPEIVYYMQKYLIEKRKIEYHGFPQERSRGNTMIYKIGPNDLLRFLVNSKDFPGNIIINRADDLPQRDSDSGKGSSGSESRDSVSSEENDMKLIVIDNLKSIEPKQQHIRIIDNKSCFERECCRCKQLFYVNFDREYMSKEYCRYHHGKLYHIYDGTNRKEYTCCKQGPNSLGCASAYRHVWNGVVDGLNGPYKGFVRTLPATSNQTQEAYALDCEMCYTADGLELTKVTVVSITGNLTYDTYVRPTNDIVDYNTRFSGITENLLIGRDVKSLNEVQSDLLKIFNEDTILIGHGLQSDMAALKLIHNTVIDTSVIYPHYKGLPIRQSLKHLTKVYLGKDIQNGTNGHCSIEDARACMEIVLDAVLKDVEKYKKGIF